MTIGNSDPCRKRKGLLVLVGTLEGFRSKTDIDQGLKGSLLILPLPAQEW